jgi:hypothetical protein
VSEPGTLAIGIGAQKCGTTSVWQALVDQPWFDAAVLKEVNYFSRRYELGPEWYRAQFLRPAPDRVRGELSVGYLIHPDAPDRIRSFDADVRLFAVLRDPVERAVSAFLHGARDGWFPPEMTLEALLAREAGRRAGARSAQLLSIGAYHRHLVRFIERFGEESLHVLFLEELATDTEAELRALFLHLGAAEDAIVPVSRLPHKNAFRRPRAQGLQRGLIRAGRRAADRGWSRLGQRLITVESMVGRPASPVERPTVPASTRSALRDYYAEEDAALARLLGRPLPW